MDFSSHISAASVSLSKLVDDMSCLREMSVIWHGCPRVAFFRGRNTGRVSAPGSPPNRHSSFPSLPPSFRPLVACREFDHRLSHPEERHRPTAVGTVDDVFELLVSSERPSLWEGGAK
jgi:hypothetical protein